MIMLFYTSASNQKVRFPKANSKNTKKLKWEERSKLFLKVLKTRKETLFSASKEPTSLEYGRKLYVLMKQVKYYRVKFLKELKVVWLWTLWVWKHSFPAHRSISVLSETSMLLWDS